MAQIKLHLSSKAFQTEELAQQVVKRAAEFVAAADDLDAAEVAALGAPGIAEMRSRALDTACWLRFRGYGAAETARYAGVPDSNRNKYQRHFTVAKAVYDDIPAPDGGTGVDSWRPAFAEMSLRDLVAYVKLARDDQRPKLSAQAAAEKAVRGICSRINSYKVATEDRPWRITNIAEAVSAWCSGQSLDAVVRLLTVKHGPETVAPPAAEASEAAEEQIEVVEAAG